LIFEKMYITLFVISIFSGFLSGFLGLGGAVIMIPLMLTIPPLFNVGNLPMKEIAGLSMLQVFFSTVFGLVIHNKNQFVNKKILLLIGIPLGLFSLLGAYFSKYMQNEFIIVLFLIVVLFSFFLLLTDKKNNDDEKNIEIVNINNKLAIFIGGVIGAVSGIVGTGGGVILIPLMIKVLKIPLRITIGTSLGIIFISAILGALGKIMSFQVNYFFVLPIVIGSLISAPFGAIVSKRVPQKIIKISLLIIIFLSFIQALFKVISIYR